MLLTYLGHAGFLAETAGALILMDPWLSAGGAFDAAWFQYPRNQHLAEPVRKRFNSSSKERYIYLSHEHNDHFDPAFLKTIDTAGATFVIPKFRRAAFAQAVAAFAAKSLVLCADGEVVPVPGGLLKVFVDDREMNRDSAVLVKAEGQSFLNLNDCKIHESLPDIVRRDGAIDAYTCQFSGASWHPACYDYTADEYRRIAREKALSKFEVVARSIEMVKPRVYLPSGGPPVFLDPALQRFNFEEGPFPRARQLIGFLDRRLKGTATAWPEIVPGDVIDPSLGRVVAPVSERPDDARFETYARSYAADYEGLFAERRNGEQALAADQLLRRLKTELSERLEALTLRGRVSIALYASITEAPGRFLRVDFRRNAVDETDRIMEPSYYAISIPAGTASAVLDKRITWQELSLTFRPKLRRVPDTYQTVIHGFLAVEDPDDIRWFCTKLQEIEGQKERIAVNAGGRRFCVDRWCPHQGGDLKQGWVEDGRYLVCGRHRMRYDLENGGRCTTTDLTIHAVEEATAPK